jgi:Pentapeptide repeats (8 copies)
VRFRILVAISVAVSSLVWLGNPGVAATHTGCATWRTVANPWTGLAITPGSNQRYANLNSLDLSCADLSGVDFYGAVIGGVNWAKSDLRNANFGGTSYCGGNFSGADIDGSNIRSTGSWACATQTNVYVAPTTSTSQSSTSTASTTIPATTTSSQAPTSTQLPTTSSIAENFYCLKVGGLGIYVRWFNSRDLNWSDVRNRTAPTAGVPTVSLVEWLAKTNDEKLALNGELALRPIPASGCSSLDEQLVRSSTTTSTTNAPPETSLFSTIPPSTTSTRSTTATTSSLPSPSGRSQATTTTVTTSVVQLVTTTTEQKRCAPTKDEIFIHSFFGDGRITNYGGVYDSSNSGFKFDYSRNCAVSKITKVLIETEDGITESTDVNVDFKFDVSLSKCWRVARVSEYGQSEWSNKVCYTAPIRGLAVTAGITKRPKTVTGAQCLNGYRTNSRSTNACSKHYGVDYWLTTKVRTGFVAAYKPRRSYSNFAIDTGSGTGRCIGICYGVPSTVNGKPRNTYVSGYFRKDGTYVRPYTRSKP